MASNPYVNKVVYGGQTLIDISGDTVAANKMLSGTTAHDKSGAAVTGSIATKTASDMSVSGVDVTAPAGYYASNAVKTLTGVTIATPASGTKTFSVTVPNGSGTVTFTFTVDSSGNVTID